jgi:hypothetical protein
MSSSSSRSSNENGPCLYDCSVEPPRAGDRPTGRSLGSRAWSAACRSRAPGPGETASARHGQRCPTSRERSRSLEGHRNAAIRHWRAARRSSRLRLDARDGRPPASSRRRRAGDSAHALDADLGISSAPRSSRVSSTRLLFWLAYVAQAALSDVIPKFCRNKRRRPGSKMRVDRCPARSPQRAASPVAEPGRF